MKAVALFMIIAILSVLSPSIMMVESALTLLPIMITPYNARENERSSREAMQRCYIKPGKGPPANAVA